MGKRMRFLFVLLVIAIFNGQHLFAQQFSRTLEVKSPRMNGADVLDLQTHLLNLGFIELGNADGYYGPKTEEVIKLLQSFLGFTKNGKVDKIFWELLFNRNMTALLKNINTVTMYSPVVHLQRFPNWDVLTVESHSVQASEGGDLSLYRIKDEIKIIQLSVFGSMGNGGYTAYILNKQYFFVLTHSVLYKEHMGLGGIASEEDNTYVKDGNAVYQIVNGKLITADDIGEVNDVISMLNGEYEFTEYSDY
jgi:hypothetical protein